MARVSGNALMEYGIIGAVVLVGALVVLVGMAGDLNRWLAALPSQMRTHTEAAVTAKTRAEEEARQRMLAAQSMSNQGTSGGTPVGISGYERFCPEPGLCVQLPVVSGGPVVTSGGNGGELTHSFSQVLTQLADQMAADPEADPALVDMIRRLANQGHAMGDYQRTHLVNQTNNSTADVQTWCENWGENSYCYQVAPDGRVIEQHEVGGGDSGYMEYRVSDQRANNPYYYTGYPASPGGATADTPNGSNPVSPLDELKGPMLTEFMQQAEAINDYLARHPQSLTPAVSALINQEVGQINTIVSSYEAIRTQEDSVGYRNEDSGDNAHSVQTVTTATTVTYITKANLTHQSANTICEGGAHGHGCRR